ncbi:TPA_asm: hypothetical protein GB020_14875 [Salmonella enterica subsp. enterica serovar Agona]|uniref:Uncharacterized protein n=1 Tax=Salmonella enterica subsp. enterica serovar Agona TaxID=58095 RepID=A0A6X8MPP4_SALET|nr:hypothetical protein [Salmonella enterica subsp. enterica serovar Agona]ECY6663149.1 hypothetical protein [Salmonella enterica]EEI9504562.1 hypothetical protein [Salmonella enterica subsp. enterica serovar Hato]HBY8281174.1 hypothetical protein [Klebsiella pneumoniae]ECF0982605.1 hypothetical protein [Salmonella enterica subsp. enterica serovar Agona]
MQCACGGETKDSMSISKLHDLRWEFVICKSCGRIDMDILFNYSRTKIILKGYQARLFYREQTINRKNSNEDEE